MTRMTQLLRFNKTRKSNKDCLRNFLTTKSAGCPRQECQTSNGAPRKAKKRDRKATEERKATLDLPLLECNCLT
jgi:hypothetical protein